jgi:hypothetical protein
MDPVGYLGPGPNQLVTVVDQQLEVGEQHGPPGRGQRLIGRRHPGDGHGVDRIRLALGPPAPLHVRERRGDLSDVFSLRQ